ncbi:MAG: hypothetical protein LBH47_00645 [Christensenellaceae bacterium]|jgi:hypothetical protein|nr:hypothetical protein [Christensenellaceae bacterium]
MRVENRKLTAAQKIQQLLKLENESLLVEGEEAVAFLNGQAFVVDALAPQTEFAVLPRNGGQYTFPKWWDTQFVIIRNLDAVPIKDQEKFIQLAENHSVSGVSIPNTTHIIFTITKGNAKLVSRRVYENLVHVTE